MRCPVCERPAARLFFRDGLLDYWCCDSCAATFLDPGRLPAAEDERAHYRLHRNEPDDEGYRQFLMRLATPLLERLPPAQYGLDYGCGPGPVLAGLLREAGHTMALYDPFFHDDATVLDRRYDFITCTEVAEHFHDPAVEFARLGRLLSPGGWLAVMTAFLNDDTDFAAWHYRRDPTHVVFYREQTFRWLAQSHGWSCEFPRMNVALLRKL